MYNYLIILKFLRHRKRTILLTLFLFFSFSFEQDIWSALAECLQVHTLPCLHLAMIYVKSDVSGEC